MANYQTVKNSLKKLESQLHDTDQRQFGGVITIEEYEKLKPFVEAVGGVSRKVGNLVVPRKLSEEEWIKKHGILEVVGP